MSTSRPLLHSLAVGGAPETASRGDSIAPAAGAARATAPSTSTGAGAASRTLVMLHGIYGRGRNWQSIAQRMTAVLPEWRALLVDLRLHGQSPAFEPPHTVLSAAEDVRALIAQVEAGGVDVGGVLGHSFGGKVALALARPLAQMHAGSVAGSRAGAGAGGGAGAPPARQIWIIDSTPEAKPPVGSAWDMLLHVRSLPDSFAARADLVAALGHFGWPEGVAQWMATNLRYVDGRYEWALDFDAMASLLESFFHTDLWDVVEHPPANVQLHFVKAIGSNTLPEPACARILRAGAANGQVHLHRLEGSHWLNSDNPQGIVDLLSTHLA